MNTNVEAIVNALGDENVLDKLNIEQLSMLLTCLANYLPICCEEGLVNALTISSELGEDLSNYAHEARGCNGTHGKESKWAVPREMDKARLDRSFARLIENLGYSSIGARDLTPDELGAAEVVGRTFEEAQEEAAARDEQGW